MDIFLYKILSKSISIAVLGASRNKNKDSLIFDVYVPSISSNLSFDKENIILNTIDTKLTKKM